MAKYSWNNLNAGQLAAVTKLIADNSGGGGGSTPSATTFYGIDYSDGSVQLTLDIANGTRQLVLASGAPTNPIALGAVPGPAFSGLSSTGPTTLVSGEFEVFFIHTYLWNNVAASIPDAQFLTDVSGGLPVGLHILKFRSFGGSWYIEVIGA